LPPPTADTKKPQVALAQLDALQGGSGKEMSAKEIGRWFTDSVVVVQNGGGSGTGFLVGADGFILTCAHCVEEDDEPIGIVYRVNKNGGTRTATVRALLVNRDVDRDLALIKVEKNAELARPVRLGNSKALESGDRLNIIGNPGLGDRVTILDNTMTEGIVSNPRRLLAGQYFLQTTAQINPGSSGGPIFNDHGLVVGLVAAKGTQIDGAGFAVPGQDIVAFLVKSATKSGANGQLRREWVDASGAHRIDATLREVMADGVKLLKSDGLEVVVPADKLSEHDREFIKLLKQ
jgi:S1-C subfamily serine protease